MCEEASVPVSAGNTVTTGFGVLTAVSLKIWVFWYVALCCAVCVVRTVARAPWPLKTSESTHLTTKESCPVRLETSDHCLKVFKNTHVQGKTQTNKSEHYHDIKGTANKWDVFIVISINIFKTIYQLTSECESSLLCLQQIKNAGFSQSQHNLTI
jgi:hypothetical protein